MEKKVIGVYHTSDPINVSGEERLEYALKEAEKQDIVLAFFNDDDIIFSQNMTRAKYKDSDGWKSVRMQIPEVVINPFPTSYQNRSVVEKKLRGMSVFTSYGVMGKYSVYKKLMESEEYSKYAIESIKVEDYRDIFSFMEKYKKIVLKPVDGRQGQGIYLIYEDRGELVLIEEGKKNIFKKEHFKMFIDGLTGEGDHIIQPYIKAVTKRGEPYDFRIHIHRDGSGEWAIVKSYPRIGSNKGILSNISRGGKTLDIDDFLQDEFSKEAPKIRKEIEELAVDLADYINSFSNNPINEMGVDIAIDENGNYYTYELNGGPQSKYHEEERAKYVIEYAKYLYNKEIEERAKNHLQYIGGEIIKIEEKLLNEDFEDEIYVGILSYPGDNESFLKASGYLGLENEVNVFYFYESDIDYYNKSINAKYYNRLNLQYKKYPYPDIIIDRLRMRGFDGYNKLYEEFKDIPFNIDRVGASVAKTYAYNLIKSEKLKKYIIPFKHNPSVDDILEFLEKDDKIILKPDLGTQGYGISIISKKGSFYEIIQDNRREKLDKKEIISKLKETLENDREQILQKYIDCRYKDRRPFDIRVHMAKGAAGKWGLVKVYAKIGAKNKVTSNSVGGGYIGELDPVLEYRFGSEKEIIYDKIIRIMHEFNHEIEKNIDGSISEIGYDVAITNDGKIYLYEINLNKPNPILYEYELAKRLIPYAIYLAKEDRKKKLGERK